MQKSSVIKILTVGVSLYVCLVLGVVSFFPDKPEDMDWKDRESYNKVQVGKLKIGANRDEVLALMGSPDITEAKVVEKNTIQIMFFRTQHVKADGLTTKDECTALLFEDNRLIALGKSALDAYSKS